MQRMIFMANFIVMIGFSLLPAGCTLTIGDHPAPVYGLI